MNVDEAMEIGAAKKTYQHLGLNNSEVACLVLHDEVERLRAELELSKANVETLKKALFEVQEAAIRLGDQVDNAKAELAAAKAASVVPVRVLGIYETEYPSDCYIEFRTGDDCGKFRDWIRDRMKERGEG